MSFVDSLKKGLFGSEDDYDEPDWDFNFVNPLFERLDGHR